MTTYTYQQGDPGPWIFNAQGTPVGITDAKGANHLFPAFSADAVGNGCLLGPDGTPRWFFNAIDPRSYGAKCDGQVVLDASISTGTTTVTVTSASALFTANDVGKLCAVLPTSTTGPWTTRSGTVTGFTSTTSITVSLSGTSGALTNAQFAWGTEDTAAWALAATAAGNQKRPLIVPAGISCVQQISIPARIPMFGFGADRSITWPWTFNGVGSTIMCLKWPGNNTTPLLDCDSGNSLTGFNLDAFKQAAMAVRSDQTGGAYMGHGIWSNMTIARGYGNVAQVGPAHSVKNCTIWGQDGAGDCVVMTGDGRLSDCDVYGSGATYAAVRATGHDVVISNNHFWKNSTTNPSGPSVFYHPSATSGHTGNFNCIGNMFDTSEGPCVSVQIDGTATAHIVKINENASFQTDGVPANTYPYIALNVASGAVIRGMSIQKNTAEPSFSGGNFGTYASFVDGSAVAGHIYGSKTGGNVIDGLAANAPLYVFSATWAGWDHDSGDVAIPYGSTSVLNSRASGTATLVGGTVTVSTPSVLAGSKVRVSMLTPGGTPGFLSVGTITAGTSFVINSTSGTDTSTVLWELVL